MLGYRYVSVWLYLYEFAGIFRVSYIRDVTLYIPFYI